MSVFERCATAECAPWRTQALPHAGFCLSIASRKVELKTTHNKVNHTRERKKCWNLNQRTTYVPEGDREASGSACRASAVRSTRNSAEAARRLYRQILSGVVCTNFLQLLSLNGSFLLFCATSSSRVHPQQTGNDLQCPLLRTFRGTALAPRRLEGRTWPTQKKAAANSLPWDRESMDLQSFR